MADTWRSETVAQLIDLYEERPCLYHTKHKDYDNRDVRSKALSQMTDILGISGKIYS